MKKILRESGSDKKFMIRLTFFLPFIFSAFYSTAQITTGFELEGNAVSVLPNPPDDWDLIYAGTHHAQVTTGIVSDLDNIFAGGGSKDDVDINNWGWTTGSVPDKDNILHGGVALYNNCKLYFFADRYATNGSSNIGFWLFKSSVSTTAGGGFSGLHTVGDLLLVSQFVNGGGTSVIKAYKWVGSGGNTNGTLDSVPVTGTTAFAICNTSSVPSPWPYNPKTGPSNQFAAGAFFEGGIDLCSIPGLDPCFASYLIETRSSFAVDAVLKDFMNGSFASAPAVSIAGASRCTGGGAATLTASVTGGVTPYTYLWSPGGSTSSSIIVSPSSNTTYTVTVTGGNGCTKTATGTVTVNPLPDVHAGADKVLTCSITSVTLSGTSSTSGTTKLWTTTGGHIVSGSTTLSPVVDAAGTYILTITSSAGCSASDTAVVTLNNTPPNVNAGPDKNLTCLVTSTILNGSSSTAGATFSWTTSGGHIVSGAATATPTVNAAGLYILTVTNPANGCTAKDTAQVFLNNTLPDVHAGPDKVLTCTVNSVVLNGSSSTGGATFSWSTTGGSIVSGALTATPTVNAAGTYILTVTHPVSGCTAKDTAIVTLNNTPPIANAGADSLINCSHPFISLNGSSGTPHVSFLWTTTGGNILSGASTEHPVINAAGTYLLTVTDSVNGCTASDSALVSSNMTAPNVNAGPDFTLTCASTSVILSGSSTTAGATFHWTASNGGAIISGANTASPLVQAPGTYILTVTNPANGCTAQDSAAVFQNVSAPDAHAGADSTLTCVVTSVILHGSTATPNTTYLWTTADGNIVSGATTLTPTVNAAGTYVLTITDTVNGCEASDVAVVFLNDTTPDISAGADGILNCNVTSLNLAGSSTTPGAMFSWTTGGGNIVSGAATATPMIDAQGSYYLLVTDPVNGCTSKDTTLVQLNNTPPNVNAGIDSVLNCYHPSISLNGSSTTLHCSFHWTTTDGDIVSGANTVIPVVDAGGTYFLTVTDSLNGCSALDSVYENMNVSPPDAHAGADTTLTCIVTSATLHGTSGTTGATFAWTAINGGAIFSGAGTANPVVQIPGTYILTVTNPATGCTATDTANVFQDINTPNANAGVDKILNCAITSLSLSGSSTTTPATYSWSTGDGNITAGGATLNPTINAPGTYVLTVTNTVNGCQSTDTAAIQLDITPPDADAGPDDILTCIITSDILSGSSSTAGALFSWYTPDGNIVLGGSTSMPTVNAPGSYILTVTGPSNGCTAKDTAVVTQNITTPLADAGADTVINCYNTSITLTGSTQTVPASYSWTTIGGNIVSGNDSLSAVVDTGGIYIFTVTDLINGCTGTDTVNVNTDLSPPDADAGPDTTLTCTVTQVNLSGSSTTAGAVFNWIATGGGAILSGANTATPLVSVPGTYVLTVTNPVSGCTAQDSAVVHYDNTVPDADAGTDIMLNCALTSAILDGSSETAGALITWTNIGGNFVADSTTFNPTVDMAGIYILTVQHPTSGCFASDTVVVTINIAVPDISAGSDTTIGCGIDTLRLHGSSNSNVGFNWTTIGGHIVADASTADPLIDSPGIYIVTVIDRISGCSASDTVVVYLSTPPVVDLGNDTTVVFCTGHLTLDAGNPGMEYLWSNGDTTQTTDVTVTGTYYVTVTNSYGCPASDTINVTVNPGIVTVDIGNDTTFMNCHALTLTLDAGNPGAVYLWSTTETTQTIMVTTSGMYYVEVTDSVGCMASDTINVTIIDNNIDVELGNDTTVCGCILLNATNPGASYLWCDGQTYATVNVCTTGTYCVTVSNGTCMDADTVHITLEPPLIVNLGNDTILVSGTLILDAGNPGSSYLWSTGDTSQTITVSSGTYYVTVTNAAGCTASDTITVTHPIGIAENNGPVTTLNIFPNPSSDKTFTIEFTLEEPADVQISIINAQGKMVYSERLSNFSGTYRRTISLDVAEGIYVTDILYGTRRSTGRIILQ